MFLLDCKVADHERVLLYKDRQLTRVLQPGRYKFRYLRRQFDTEVFDISGGEFFHSKAKVLSQHPALNEQLMVVKTSAHEVALVTLNARLHRIMAPDEERFYWKDAGEWQVTLVDLTKQVRLPDALLSEVMHLGFDRQLNKTFVVHSIVPAEHVGLRFQDGKLIETLAPGRYGFWAFNRVVQVEQVDTRLQNEEITGQEILTKDRVSIRLNLNASFHIQDAETFITKVRKGNEHIYRVLQLALREAVGTRTLDALLEDKQVIGRMVSETAQTQLRVIGVKLESVGVRDIILPGDMKDILNQVVQAQKAAEANVIKRREETSATRSLHNTAKLMENNPVLLRLKELEALEKISERIEKIQVVGGLDQVLNLSKLLT